MYAINANIILSLKKLKDQYSDGVYRYMRCDLYFKASRLQ